MHFMIAGNSFAIESHPRESKGCARGQSPDSREIRLVLRCSSGSQTSDKDASGRMTPPHSMRMLRSLSPIHRHRRLGLTPGFSRETHLGCASPFRRDDPAQASGDARRLHARERALAALCALENLQSPRGVLAILAARIVQ
jgi:hypothetical protein